VWIALLLLACGDDELAKRKAAMDKAAQADKAATKPDPAPSPPKDLPPATPKPTRAPEPEPTTPAEIDHARNQAMIDGRDKDVLRYCEMGKLDAKSNPQALLGCTLSACRLKDADTARRYGKPLAKAYLDNATRVCAQNQIVL
jgi:hypothetical protein